MRKEIKMVTVALFVRLQAKPGKEADVESFLKQGLSMANQEITTPIWFALRLGPSTFGIFDAFVDEAGRSAHLSGPIAVALKANAADLLAEPPQIEHVDILGVKLPG
jgi:quinol monooxygenase YgiN